MKFLLEISSEGKSCGTLEKLVLLIIIKFLLNFYIIITTCYLSLLCKIRQNILNNLIFYKEQQNTVITTLFL